MEEKKRSCAVLGGDLRQVRLCALLEQDSWQVSAFGLEGSLWNCPDLARALKGAQWAVLPMPAEKDGALNAPLAGQRIELAPLLEQIGQLDPECLLLAGLPSQQLRRLAQEKGLRLADYGVEEALTRQNAAITAEAALALAMERREQTVFGSSCLVIGYGRIGRALCQRLRSLGAQVTAAARKPEDLVQARCDYLEAVDLAQLEQVLPSQQLIFNTAPALILNRPRLALVTKDTLVIDLASNPGGPDLLRRRDGHTPCQLGGCSCLGARSRSLYSGW